MGITRFGRPLIFKRVTGATRSTNWNCLRSWYGFKPDTWYLFRILSCSFGLAISKVVGDLIHTMGMNLLILFSEPLPKEWRITQTLSAGVNLWIRCLLLSGYSFCLSWCNSTLSRHRCAFLAKLFKYGIFFGTKLSFSIITFISYLTLSRIRNSRANWWNVADCPVESHLSVFKSINGRLSFHIWWSLLQSISKRGFKSLFFFSTGLDCRWLDRNKLLVNF